MDDLSLHILDIVENSISAGARHIGIRVRENLEQDVLEVRISDDGRGMSQEMLASARHPFFTTRSCRRIGLGLSLFEQAARRAGGDFEIESREGAGTTVTARFQHSHIDRQPLGDMTDTLLTLMVGNPEVEFTYGHQAGPVQISLSSSELAAELNDVPLNSPQGIAALKSYLERLRQPCEQ